MRKNETQLGDKFGCQKFNGVKTSQNFREWYKTVIRQIQKRWQHWKNEARSFPVAEKWGYYLNTKVSIFVTTNCVMTFCTSPIGQLGKSDK